MRRVAYLVSEGSRIDSSVPNDLYRLSVERALFVLHFEASLHIHALVKMSLPRQGSAVLPHSDNELKHCRRIRSSQIRFTDRQSFPNRVQIEDFGQY